MIPFTEMEGVHVTRILRIPSDIRDIDLGPFVLEF